MLLFVYNFIELLYFDLLLVLDYMVIIILFICNFIILLFFNNI